MGPRTTSVTSEERQADWRRGGDAGTDGDGEADRQRVGPAVSEWSDGGRRRRAERRTEMDGGRATPV